MDLLPYTSQLSLLPITQIKAEGTITERFARFHSANPHVYDALRTLAFDARSAGVVKISVDLLYAVLRWHYIKATRGDDGFKLNDHFTAHYARLLMDRNPALKGLFETRRLRAA